MSLNAHHSCTGKFVQHNLTMTIALQFELLHSDMIACLSQDMHVISVMSYKQLLMLSHIKVDQQPGCRNSTVSSCVEGYVYCWVQGFAHACLCNHL